MSEYFSSINPENTPDGEAPQLDAEYWSTKAEGLLPGEIVHPRPFSSLFMDRSTKKLYVKADYEFDNDSYKPTPGYYGERYGLLRIYRQDDDEKMLNGVVVDIRALGKGGVRSQDVSDTDTYAGMLAAKNLEKDDYMSVLGYVFTDFEGNTSYKGLEQLQQDARFLAETVDELRQPAGSEKAEQAAAKSTAEKEALSELKEIFNVADADEKTAPRSETPIGDALEAIKNLPKPSAVPEKPQKKHWPWKRK